MSDINFVSKKTMIFIDEKTFCKIGALNFQKLLPKKKKDPACKERGLLNLQNLKNLKTTINCLFVILHLSFIKPSLNITT